MNGDHNPADLGTKHLTRLKIDELLEKISLTEAIGHADTSLKM